MKKIILLLILTIIFSGCTKDQVINKDISEEKPVVYLSLMVHLEGWKNEAENKIAFEKHAQAIRYLAAILNEYDAKATFEASPEFVKACKQWNDNVMLELVEQGHGIGVHADLGGKTKDGLTQQQLKVMREDLEKLTGHEILHVSGVCSELDWVQAAIDGGYKFVTGGVGYCAMSLPENQRPQEYKNCPTPIACHGVMPLDLAERLHPWQTSSGQDWLKHDPQGKIVILSSDGGLKFMAEENNAVNVQKTSEFNQLDIEVYISKLDEAISLTKADQVSLLYPGLSLGSAQIDKKMYQQWLEEIQPYINSGQAEWKALPGVYKIYTQTITK